MAHPITGRESFVPDHRPIQTAGGPKVMLSESIPKPSKLQKFKWTNCNVPDCATVTSHKAGRSKVKEPEKTMEHDVAETTPWT